MLELEGTPSDGAPQVLATGRADVRAIFLSLARRDPDGRDAEYLWWHCFDHRPEQYRLDAIRSSLRLVSTPECRAARAASNERYDATDHVMTYFFRDLSGIGPFADLGAALGAAGRMKTLPSVEFATYALRGAAAAPRIKVGADVLPWWPATGGYLLLESGPGQDTADDAPLLAVAGVAGALQGEAVTVEGGLSNAGPGTRLTYLLLDDDPVAVAKRLRPVLEGRWQAGAEPLLAAPFHVVLPADVTRHLP
jgi:hypothetical protein